MGRTGTCCTLTLTSPPLCRIMSSRDKTTRVDGLGLWRSWTRNFKTKQLALLDLIDNSLDAAIEGHNCDGFAGKVHLFPDIYGKAGYDKTTTGICIVNNCKNPIRPLGKVLEAYNWGEWSGIKAGVCHIE